MSKTSDVKPSEYYAKTNKREAQMHRLISLRLRNVMTLEAFYNKDRKDESGYGLFDVVCPDEEADLLVEDLRLFGFLPDKEASQ